MVNLKEQLIQFLKFLDAFEDDDNLYGTKVKIGNITYIIDINDVFGDGFQGYLISFYDELDKVEYILDLNNCTFIEIAQGDCIDCICFRKDLELVEMAYNIKSKMALSCF